VSIRILVLGIGVLSALVFTLPFGSGERGVAAEVLGDAEVEVRRGSFEVRVQVVGELKPVRATTVFSGIKSDRGKIIFLIDDGTEVAADDVLVRFDPTPFEEEVTSKELEVDSARSIVEAKQQALEWEKVQATRRIKTAQFELEVAALDLHRLERGDGPLELARMEMELAERTSEWEEQSGFLGELEGLLARGHVNTAEVEQVKKRAEKANRTAELAKRQFETYRDFILPTRKATLKHGVEQADAELEQTRKSAEFKIAEVAATVQQVQRDLEAVEGLLRDARAELERTVLRAPLPGMVVLLEDFRDGERRVPRVGDSVWQNQPLLYLPDLSQMVVQTQVREVDVHRVRPGNEGVVRLDAYPELTLPASVRSIGVLAERERGYGDGEKSFQMLVDLASSEPRLRPGMTARVDILSVRIDDELVVPIQALWGRGGETWCWVVTASGHERRVVERGPASRYEAVVVSGLAEGERLSLVEPEGAGE
jgi:HlyD family secretion protein